MAFKEIQYLKLLSLSMFQLEQVLGQRQRRRPRLDPTKIDVKHVTGDENVSVVNRATGKRITGAKAPPIRYLKEWLQRNPEYDVDPKWGHIVKAKASVGYIQLYSPEYTLAENININSNIQTKDINKLINIVQLKYVTRSSKS